MLNTNVIDRIPSRIGLQQIEVFEANDLPAPSGGVITLPSGSYILKADIELADSFFIPAGGNVEFSSVGLNARITYTGASAFIQSDPASEALFGNFLKILLIDNGATLFDTDGLAIVLERVHVEFTGTAGSLGIVRSPDPALSICDSRIVGYAAGLQLMDVPLFQLSDVDLIPSGVLSGASLQSGAGIQDGIYILDGVRLEGPSGADIFDFDPTFTGVASITRFVNSGGSGFFAAGSLDETDPRINVRFSPPQKSSENIGSFAVGGNAAVTVIPGSGTWVDLDLGGLAVLASDAERWSLSDATLGELRYDGVDPFNGRIIASFSAISMGAPEEFQFRVVVNGAPLSDGIVGAAEIRGELSTVFLTAPVTVVDSDLVRIQVQNVMGMSNIVVQGCSVAIS